LYVQDEYVQGYQAHPQQTQALPFPRSFHKHPHVTLLLELALIVQPITVRDEQLLETSGKILDYIVSLYLIALMRATDASPRTVPWVGPSCAVWERRQRLLQKL
jgi:hypothetical protein